MFSFTDMLNMLKEKETEYGGLFLSWIGPFPIAVVSEPQLAQDVLNSPNCVNKSFVYKGVEDATGRGLFTLDGKISNFSSLILFTYPQMLRSCVDPEWSYHRKLLNPAFSHKILLSFIPIFNKEVDNLIKVFETIQNSNVDLATILQNFTLSIATRKYRNTNYPNFNAHKYRRIDRNKLIFL